MTGLARFDRCRSPEEYPSGSPNHPKSLHVQEEAVVGGRHRWLATLFDDDDIDDTCERLAGSSEPDRQADAREAKSRHARVR